VVERADPDDRFRARLDAINAPLERTLAELTATLSMHTDARHTDARHTDARSHDAITRAVVDLPNAALRRYMRDGARLPSWLEEDIAAAARKLLQP
jgi:hypothetical protein